MRISAKSNQKYPNFIRFIVLTGLALTVVGKMADAAEPAEKSKKSNSKRALSDDLFQSRFKLNKDNQPDLSVFNSCPSSAESNAANTPSSSFYAAKSRKSTNLGLNNILLNADQVPISTDSKTLLEGNVRMTSSSSLLKADRMISDTEKQKVTATGNVSLETEDSLLEAKKFEGDQVSESSVLTDVDFLFFSNHANGKAESITLDSSNVATLNELTFSTCPKNNESWRFSASELQLDQNSGWGEAWGMWLKVKGIPIFYFPYLNFPLNAQRKSGLLAPEFSNSDTNGLDISIPIYWNIAPQADATFRPRNIQNRGNQLGAEFRYLTEISSNRFSFEWLKNDQLAIGLLNADPSLRNGLYSLSEDRWAASFKNTTRFNSYWSASIDANKVSDRDYFRDLGTGLINSQGTNSQSQLLSQANFSYQDDIWHISLLAESTQSLVGDEPYRLAPSLQSSADYYHPESGVRWQFTSDFSQFTHSNSLKVDGIRLNLKPSVSFPLRNSFAWLIPKLEYQLSQYQQNDPLVNTSTSINRALPILSIDSGLFFDRSIQWGEKSMTHSLEPRLLYAYIPFRNQDGINNFDSRVPEFSFSQLWQANRFAGIDRVGDTNHIALAVTNRFVDDQTGQQRLSFSIGKRFYFDDRRVQLSGSFPIQTVQDSPWLVDLNYQVNSQLELSGFIEWNDNTSDSEAATRTNLARSRIKFEPIQDHIVNLSHRVRNTNGFSNEELDLSFAWPINDEWRVVGRWYNDLLKNRTSETMFGFEYESCCWALSLVSRRYIDIRLDAAGEPIMANLLSPQEDDYKSGIQLQFVFKGLGSPGQNSVSKLLENSIRGYRSRF